jgi:hypothetical protein
MAVSHLKVTVELLLLAANVFTSITGKIFIWHGVPLQLLTEKLRNCTPLGYIEE